VVALVGAGLAASTEAGRTQDASARAAPQSSAARADLVVAQDGSGTYRSIQAALDAIPPDNTSLKVVLVRNGTYREKVFVRASHVAVVGEDRDRTRVEFPELRRHWRASHPDDWGAAVVNVGDAVTDLTIGNLTVENSYGRLHGDHDHQFAIRSGGSSTRIALLHANFIAGGGDTVSLWNVRSGLAFHSNCYFEGWVDYVCPRGWCYVGASRFFGHNLTASLWHDGSGDPDQKLVVRDSHVDGVPGFPLGRFNRDGQFFILDTTLAATVADRPIYPASAPDTYKWGTRTYFHGTRRAGGDFAWHADNLATAPGTPAPRDVTPAWTFGGRWNPEATVPAVLPFASLPRPRDGAHGAAVDGVTLRWIAARDATRHRVAFGTTTPPPVVGDTRETSYDPGALQPGTTYFWRVDAVTPRGVAQGATWSFTTGGAAPRTAPPRAGLPPPPLVRLLLVGDSTVTDEAGWGRGLRERFGPRVEITNLARNGRSSRSYRAEGHWAEAVSRPAQYVLVQFGHNDQPGKGPARESAAETAFREHLTSDVEEARAAGIAPILVTPLPRRRFGRDGAAVSDLESYADAVRAVAAARAVPLIDLHARGLEVLTRLGADEADRLGPLREDGTPDRTHLNDRGSALFGGIVATRLVELVPALVQHAVDGGATLEAKPRSEGQPGPPAGPSSSPPAPPRSEGRPTSPSDPRPRS
jgi:pectinesterase